MFFFSEKHQATEKPNVYSPEYNNRKIASEHMWSECFIWHNQISRTSFQLLDAHKQSFNYENEYSMWNANENAFPLRNYEIHTLIIMVIWFKWFGEQHFKTQFWFNYENMVILLRYDLTIHTIKLGDIQEAAFKCYSHLVGTN